MALFKPGQSGNPNGRGKGVKNKFKVNVLEACEKYKCNPFEIMAQIANGGLDGEKATIKERLSAASELGSYLAPKLKSVEHSGATDGAPLAVVLMPDNGKKPVNE